MAQYIKPSIKFVSAATPLSVASGCTTSAEDLRLLGEIFGIDETKLKTAFSVVENCQDQYPIENYCKYTAVENGVAAVVLGS